MGDEAILSYNLELLRKAGEDDLVVISPLPEITRRFHGVKCIPNYAREEIITRKIRREDCTFIAQPYTWREIKAFFGLMDVVIAVSFHSAVFSLSMNVPTLGLYEGEYYRMKMQGIFDLVGLSNFAMDAAKADFSEILSRFRELLDKRGKIGKFLTSKNVSLGNNCGFATKTLINTL